MGGTGRRPRTRGASPEVQRITSVRSPLAEDIAQRNRRYLIQMSVRVACFLATVAIDHWTRWLFLVGAVVLPYIAVVLANAGRERGTDPGTYVEARGLPMSPATGPTNRPAPEGAAAWGAAWDEPPVKGPPSPTAAAPPRAWPGEPPTGGTWR